MSSLADNIKRYRDFKGFTQEDLARNSGLTKDYISKLERGEQSNPRRQTIEAIASALDVDFYDLLPSDNRKSKNQVNISEKELEKIIEKDGWIKPNKYLRIINEAMAHMTQTQRRLLLRMAQEFVGQEEHEEATINSGKKSQKKMG